MNYDELDAFAKAAEQHWNDAPLPSDSELIASGIEAAKKPAKAR